MVDSRSDKDDPTRIERGSSRPPASGVDVTVVEGSSKGAPDSEKSGVARHELTETELFSDGAQAPSSDPDPMLAMGTEVDHFRTMRLLGRGGMGEVYLARDTKLGRKVALKIVLADVLKDQGEKERFLFEARATAALNHPHIVTIYGAGEYDGRPYVALEYLEGRNLRERLREKEPSLTELLRIALAIARALAHAHLNGILHRDLKPANVVLAYDGHLRVVDFGLAKVLTEDVTEEDPSFIPGLAKLQKSGDDTWTAGTPSYMAPEQWRGESGAAATDVWALGVILFELCMGRKPFEGENTMMLAAVVCSLEPAPSVVADVPRELVQLVARCLDKKLERRPSSQDAVEVLERLLDEQAKARGAEDEEPFRGLLPFDEAQAGFFFGREMEVAAFLERLRLQPILPVVGPSGAGKSSFVRAGVLPRLREQGDWRILEIRPQGHPFRALAVALSQAEGGGLLGELEELLLREPAQLALRLRDLADDEAASVLLFVDQLEELFTLAEPKMARLFLEALYAAADDALEPVRVAFTLRQDFLDRLATDPRMSAALGHLTVIQRPGREALERIVRRPIEMRGYAFEDEAMVDEMVDDVADSPACLPLLSFAARRLWEERDTERELILRQHYDEMGGVGGALASHADGVIAGLSRSERQVAREILLRLVTPERTRQIVRLDELVGGLGPEGEHVLSRLTDARLVSVLDDEANDSSTVELAHESLIQTWHRLTRWVDESRDDLAFFAEVGQAAELWAKRGRRPEELWQGDALAEAWRAAERLSSRAPVKVVEFLERGRQYQRSRKVRRRVLVTIAFVALAFVAVGLGLQKREADRQRALAVIREGQSEQRRADALREGARAAMGEGSWLEARAKLRSALEIEDHPAARALWWQLSREPLRWRAPLATTVYAVAYAPDGKTVAAACQDGAVYLVDAVERRTRLLRGHGDQVFAVAFSPDGKLIASGSFGGALRIWDRVSGKVLHKMDAHPATLWALAFSPDGKTLASSSGDRTVALWDAQTGKRTGTVKGHDADVFGVAFSPDGQRIATGSYDHSVRLWSRAGEEQRVMRGHTGRVFSVVFSPDGKLIASASRDGTARLWRVADGELVHTLKDETGLFGVSFSPDGKTLATSGRGGAVRLWDVVGGQRKATLDKEGSVALGVAFSPDGRWVVSGHYDGGLRLWSAAGSARELDIGPHEGGVNRIAVAPDDDVLATAGSDHLIRLWRLSDGRPFRVLSGHEDIVRSVVFSPDGKRLVSGGHDRDLRIWDVASGTVERVLAGHRDAVFSVDVDPTGRWLASAGRDADARIWDLETGQTVTTLAGHEDDIRDIGYSPDGNALATASTDESVRLWDASTGRMKKRLTTHVGGAEGIAFAPDGGAVASGGRDGAVRWSPTGAAASRVLLEAEGRVYWLGLHPDGELVAAPYSTGLIRLAGFGREPQLLRGHRNEANTVEFSASGAIAISGSDDGTVRTWQIPSGKPFWRAPALGGLPLRLFTHRGWTSLDGKASEAPRGWSTGLVAAIEERAQQVVLAGERACLRTGDTMELWALDRDAPLATERVEELAAVVATPAGCAAVGAKRAVLASGDGIVSLDAKAPRAVGSTLKGLAVATDDGILLFDGEGRRTGERSAGPGIRALAGLGGDLLVGYRDGHVERLGVADALPFEGTPNAVPTVIFPGPGGTLVVGYGDGTVGMWARKGGPRLARARLHGSILHIVARDERIHIASDLGQLLSWRVEAFHVDRCDLLREVWEQVPVVWEGGRAVARVIPEGHGCVR